MDSLLNDAVEMNDRLDSIQLSSEYSNNYYNYTYYEDYEKKKKKESINVSDAGSTGNDVVENSETQLLT